MNFRIRAGKTDNRFPSAPSAEGDVPSGIAGVRDEFSPVLSSFLPRYHVMMSLHDPMNRQKNGRRYLAKKEGIRLMPPLQALRTGISRQLQQAPHR